MKIQYSYLLSVSLSLSLAVAVTAGCSRAQQVVQRKAQALAPFERTGTTLKVPNGGDLQGAIDAAQPGDTITLAVGGTYRGPITLKPKKGDAVITIQPADASLAGDERTRIRKEAIGRLPRIVCTRSSAIRIPAGAHHYRLNGLEVTPDSGDYETFDMVEVGDPEYKSLQGQAHSIELDHMIIHADANKGGKRGIGLHGANVTIRNSLIYDFKSNFQDAQAILGFTGSGPYRIINNYLEASGENIMFGGAAPRIPNLVPSDIEVYHNHFSRPLSWKELWRVKNLFELKNARRVKVISNIFENNWAGAQAGFAVLFTVRTCEGGDYPWAAVEDVEFSGNILRNIEQGISFMGLDDVRGDCGGKPPAAGVTQRIRIHNNLIQGPKRGFMVLSGSKNITLDHNTLLATDITMIAAGAPSPNLIATNNVFVAPVSGVHGDSNVTGLPSMQHYFPGFDFRANVLPGSSERSYPPGNFFPPDMAAIGFTNPEAGDYSLSPKSRWRGKGIDGTNPGADMVSLQKGTGGVVEGILPPSAATK